jgi:AcrR family transcriptional regulator
MVLEGDDVWDAPVQGGLRGGGRHASSSREKMLAAAVQVAIRDGILAMTLEAVAKEAGVSKGGLLHHFATKEDLIAAMLEHYSWKVQQALEARIAGDGNPRGRFFRSFVKTIFEPPHTGGPGWPAVTDLPRFLAAILAASANNPKLLAPLRARMSLMRERLLAEGPNGLRQLALWPAMYGLLLWKHLGVIADDDPLRQSMIDELLALAEGPFPSEVKE